MIHLYLHHYLNRVRQINQYVKNELILCTICDKKLLLCTDVGFVKNYPFEMYQMWSKMTLKKMKYHICCIVITEVIQLTIQGLSNGPYWLYVFSIGQLHVDGTQGTWKKRIRTLNYGYKNKKDKRISLKLRRGCL